MGGLLLIAFSFMIMLSATPTVYSELDTGPGSHFENATDIEKESYRAGRQFYSVMPMMLFIGGLVVTVKGL